MEGNLSDLYYKLDCIFKLLSDSETDITDDTLLEKLLSLLETILHRNETNACTLRRETCLFNFLEVLGASYCHPSLPFGIRLVGILLKQSLTCDQAESLGEVKNASRSNDVFTKVFDTCLSQSNWDNASVRCGWINGLQSITTFLPGLELVYSKDFINRIYDSLQDSSLFVIAAATKFFQEYMIQLQAYSSTSEKYRARANDLFTKFLLVMISNKDQHYPDSFKISVLQILIGCCNKCDDAEGIARTLIHLNQSLSGIEWFVNKLQSDNKKLTQETVEFIRAIHKHSVGDTREEIRSLPRRLFNLGKYSVAVKLAQVLINNRIDEDNNMLLSLVMLPIVVLNGNGKPDDDDIFPNLKEYLTRDSKQQLLCHCLNVLCSLIPESTQLHCLQELETLLHHTIDRSNSRVLNAIISVLTCIKCEIQQTTDASVICNIIICLLSILNDSFTDYQVTDKVLKCVANLLPVPLKHSQMCNIASILSILADAVKKRSCDRRWEVRDSTMETLGIISTYASDDSIVKWMCDYKLGAVLWGGIQDGESYVRASGIQALSKWINCCSKWELIIDSVSITKTQILDHLMLILSTDTEAFPRRAAASAIVVLYNTCLGEDMLPCIYKAMHCAVQDFDWEVKMEVLKFWEQVISKNRVGGISKEDCKTTVLPSYAIAAVSNGTAFSEETILNHKEIHSDLFPLKCGNQDVRSDTTSSNYKNESDLPHSESGFMIVFGTGCFSALFSAIEDYDQPVKAKACQLLLHLKETYCRKNEKCHTVGTVANENNLIPNNQEEIMSKLCSLNLNEMLKEFSCTTDDYDRNPMLLLDDILAVVKQKEDDVLVDCY